MDFSTHPLPYRRSIRIKGFDYTRPGQYFITICLMDSGHSLAIHKNGNLSYTPVGIISKRFWCEIPNHFPNTVLDEYIIMPDHMHGILRIKGKEEDHDNKGAYPFQCRAYQEILPCSLSIIINHFKGAVKRWCNKNGFQGFKWHRNYYEHVITSENHLEAVRRYIRKNPEKLNMRSEGAGYGLAMASPYPA